MDMKEILKIEILDEAVQHDLVRKAQAGDLDARNKLIYHNLRMILSIAYRYQNNPNGSVIDVDDLFQEGYFGLNRAIDLYDFQSSIFSTYAYTWIQSKILRYLTQRLIHVPYNSNAEDKPMVYLSDEVRQESVGSIKTTVADTIGDYEYGFETVEDRADIDKAVSALTEREKDIVYLYYGIYDGNDLSLSEISEKYNMTKEGIRQIKKKSLKKLVSMLV